jgi:GAF domain-containing protein
MNTVHTHDDALTRLRVRFIQAFAIFAILIVPFALAVSFVEGTVTPDTLMFPAVAVLVNIVLLILVQQRRLGLATIGLIGILVAGAINIPADTPWVFLPAMLALIAAAVLGNQRIYIIANILVLGRVIIEGARALQASSGQVTPLVTQLLVLGITLVIVSIATRYTIESVQRAARNAERNTSVLRATATVGQITATLLKLDELLPRAVDVIRDNFAFYHVQVFLINETGDQAVLVASTGEVGQRLLERQHRLAVGSKSIIGRVTQAGEPVIARDTDKDTVHFRNELLPNTRAELAIPLIDGTTIIGALDVQSTRANAFQPTDVQALQVLANLLATAIRNARLFEKQVQTAQENKRYFLESEANLREIQRLNQRLTKTGWDNYLGQRNSRAGVTLEADQVLQDADWTETLIRASQSREPIKTASGGEQIIAVPVVLRGEVIGAIEVEPGQELEETEALEMVQAVAQRLAVSLDNTRLFEEAQLATAQEQRINAIVSQYQAVSSVDDLLRITLTELSQSLGAQRGAIRLGNVQNEHSNGGSPS